MKLVTARSHARRLGYTIVEALVASAVLMVGIGAAAALSLSLLTQEEINERTVRAMNYLDNATALYRLGVPAGEIANLLPAEPVVDEIEFKSVDETVPGLGTISTMEITLTFTTTSTDQSWGEGKWTGGKKGVERTHTVRAFRGSQYITPTGPGGS